MDRYEINQMISFFRGLYYHEIDGLEIEINGLIRVIRNDCLFPILLKASQKIDFCGSGLSHTIKTKLTDDTSQKRYSLFPTRF